MHNGNLMCHNNIVMMDNGDTKGSTKYIQKNIKSTKTVKNVRAIDC